MAVSSRGGRERRFTLEEVLTAALALIDEAGLEALTMRRLAEELGVTAMTLYGYVRTKEEIVDGVYALALEELRADIDRGAPWDEQLTVAIRHLHDSLRAHPGLVDLLFARSVPGRGIDRVREELLGILRRAGFSSRDAVRAHGAAVSYAMGFAVAERARTASSFDHLRELEAGEFPYLSEVAAEYDDHLSDSAFEYGLAHLVEGLRKDRRPD